MQKLGWWEDAKAFLGQEMDYLNSNIDNEAVIYNMHSLVTSLHMNFDKTIDAPTLKIIFLETLKLLALALSFQAQRFANASPKVIPDLCLSGLPF